MSSTIATHDLYAVLRFLTWFLSLLTLVGLWRIAAAVQDGSFGHSEVAPATDLRELLPS